MYKGMDENMGEITKRQMSRNTCSEKSPMHHNRPGGRVQRKGGSCSRPPQRIPMRSRW